MATADDIDPVQASRRATEGLQRAIESLDRHIEANAAATMEMALVQKKRASEIGLEELEPSSLTRKFISQTGPGANIGASEPGRLNPDASEPFKEQPIYDEGIPGSQGRRKVGGIIPQGVSSNASSPVAGMSWGQAASMEEEPILLPQFGNMQIDRMLALSAQVAAKRAMGNYRKYASQAGDEAMPAGEWLENQGPIAAGNAANFMTQASKAIVPIKTAYQHTLAPIFNIGFGASNMGASLGYSPQAGTGINASHILGIPNPIAAFSSPAARQGLGSTVNALEMAIGGTGLGISEAQGLVGGLAAHGWANQREGGLLGATVGGEQANLALALEPLAKGPFKSKLALEQLTESTSMLRLGHGTPKELAQVMGELPESAKILHKTLEETTSAMEDFTTKTVENGSSMLHGAQAYNEIIKTAGISPHLVQEANESNFGKAQAIQKGVIPWEISTLSGGQQAVNASQTVEKLESYVKNMNFQGKKVANKYGEIQTTTPEAQKYAFMHMMDPSMSTETMERLHKQAKAIGAVESGMPKLNELSAWVSSTEHGEEARGPNVHAALKSESEWRREQAFEKQIREKLKREPSNEGLITDLTAVESNAKEKYHAMIVAKEKAGTGSKKLNTQHEIMAKEKFEGPMGLYQRAKEAEIPTQEIEKWKTEPVSEKISNIKKAFENVNAVNTEKEEKAKQEEQVKISLTENAEKWFKLQFPKAKNPKEEQNAGGKQTSSQAASSKAPGPLAQEEAMQRQGEQLLHNKQTTAAE